MKPKTIFGKVLLIGFFLLAGSVAFAQGDIPPEADQSDSRWAIPLEHPIEPGLGDWRIVYVWNPPFSEADVRAGKKRLSEILAEISQTTDPLVAGAFVSGSETTVERLWFAPRSGFVMVSLSTCSHSVQRLTYGRCAATGEGIALFPEGGTPLKKWGVRGSQFIRITQRHRELLVPKDSVPDFCQAIVGRGLAYGSEFSGLFFGRYADNWKVSDTETPLHLPRAFQKYALEPVRAEVVSVREPFLRTEADGEHRMVVQMTINAGANIKLRPMNELHVCLSDVSWYFETVKVVKVSARTALVECHYPIEDATQRDGAPQFSPAEQLEKLKREHPFRPGVKVSSLWSDVPETVKPEPAEASSK